MMLIRGLRVVWFQTDDCDTGGRGRKLERSTLRGSADRFRFALKPPLCLAQALRRVRARPQTIMQPVLEQFADQEQFPGNRSTGDAFVVLTTRSELSGPPATLREEPDGAGSKEGRRW